MSKSIHYVVAAALILALGWFAWQWHRAPRTVSGAVGGSSASIGGSSAIRGQIKEATGAKPIGNAARRSDAKPVAKPARAKGGGRGPVAVRVATVAGFNVEERVSAVGTVLAAQSVLVKPEIEGRIAHIALRDGESLAAGRLMFQLDDAVVDAQVKQAQAVLSLARSNLKRTRNLARQNFVSQRSRDEARSSVSVLEARLQVEKARQSRTRIVAPFAGVAGLLQVNVGDYVKAGETLVRFDDLSSLKVDFRVPERLLARVRAGQPINLRFDAYPDKAFTARVETIDSQIDKSGRAVVVRGRIDNRARLLRPGMFARASVVIAARANALMVPEECVVPGADGLYVFRVEQGKARRVRVTTGVRQDGRIEVVAGLAEGDQIVSAGQIKLRGPTPAVRILNGADAAKAKAKASGRSQSGVLRNSS